MNDLLEVRLVSLTPLPPLPPLPSVNWAGNLMRRERGAAGGSEAVG